MGKITHVAGTTAVNVVKPTSTSERDAGAYFNHIADDIKREIYQLFLKTIQQEV